MSSIAPRLKLGQTIMDNQKLHELLINLDKTHTPQADIFEFRTLLSSPIHHPVSMQLK
jgi:hypothetical protein